MPLLAVVPAAARATPINSYACSCSATGSKQLGNMPGQLLAPLASTLTRLSLAKCTAFDERSGGGLEALTRLRSLDLSKTAFIKDSGAHSLCIASGEVVTPRACHLSLL